MGFLRKVILSCKLFLDGRKGLWNESYLAYYVKKGGFDTYSVKNASIALIAWHILHESSLIKKEAFGTTFEHIMMELLCIGG